MNKYGQLGNGSKDDSVRPVPVPAPLVAIVGLRDRGKQRRAYLSRMSLGTSLWVGSVDYCRLASNSELVNVTTAAVSAAVRRVTVA